MNKLSYSDDHSDSGGQPESDGGNQEAIQNSGHQDNQSIWLLKPWWCQPWSITSTGIGAVATSWFLLERWWLTVAAAAAVLIWWWLFLVVVPAAYRRGEI